MNHRLSLYFHLMKMQMRTRLQYRASLVIGWVAQAFGYASVYGTIWIIASRFEKLGGWAWPEIALMLGFHVLGYALGALFTLVQLRRMEELVRLGTYDTLLVRPVSPWAFLVFSGVNIEYGGHIALGIGMMAWAIPQLGIDWSWPAVLYLALSLISAALLTGAMITMIGATALVLTRSRYLFGIYFDFWELSRYPLSVFALPLQFVLLSAMPLGYMAYVPVAALLGKPVPLLGAVAPFAALLAGPVAGVIAAMVWKACQRRYQGAGGCAGFGSFGAIFKVCLPPSKSMPCNLFPIGPQAQSDHRVGRCGRKGGPACLGEKHGSGKDQDAARFRRALAHF